MGASVQVIEDNCLKILPEGFEISLRLNWYRSLPISCLEKIEVSIDGEPVPAEKLFFGINGHEYALNQLADKVDEFWFVQDSVRIIARQPGKILAGKTYMVDGVYDLRIPYILIGPNKYLINANRYHSSQVAG